jgi:hypothetical protein
VASVRSNPNSSENGGFHGYIDDDYDDCMDSRCDTQGFVEAVNYSALCGASDWRMPTRFELTSIIDRGYAYPAMDLHYFPFPDAELGLFWSSSPSASKQEQAWSVHVKYNGTVGDYATGATSDKDWTNSVRLVRP